MILNLYRVYVDHTFTRRTPVYRATTCLPEEPYQLIAVELPDGWSWRRNENAEPVLDAPDGVSYLVHDCIYVGENEAPFIRCATGVQQLRWTYADNNIRSLRQMRGLTQSKLAERSGINSRTIQRIETSEIDLGNLTAKNFMALAKALDVQADELLIGDNPMGAIALIPQEQVDVLKALLQENVQPGVETVRETVTVDGIEYIWNKDGFRCRKVGTDEWEYICSDNDAFFLGSGLIVP